MKRNTFKHFYFFFVSDLHCVWVFVVAKCFGLLSGGNNARNLK